MVRALALAPNRDVSGAEDSEGGTYETFIKTIKHLNPWLRAKVRARVRPSFRAWVRAKT